MNAYVLQLKNKIRYAEELVARYRTQLANIEREEAKPAAEVAAKLRAKRAAKHWGIKVDDEMKTDGRISVWPSDSCRRSDPHEGGHYIYSWVEAEKRVEDYVRILKAGSK